MDPTNTILGRMLIEEITPVVMVLGTPHVEDACGKNGLNLVQMLHPFSLFSNIDVPVRTASDQPYRLQMFKLRLIYAYDIHLESVPAANERLKQLVSNASEDALSDLQCDPPSNETAFDSLPHPLFQSFNRELLHSLSFSDHEAFDHPVACLLVVSTKDEHPINKFVDLFNTDQLPSLLNEGAMDPKVLKHYLLVHDNQDGNLEKANNILTEMRSTFGLNDCSLLCINSAIDADERIGNPWASYKYDNSQPSELGCLLSSDDCDEMKDLMQELASRRIIPHMEQKVRLLNQQVSATRRGFRNQIKNLWWRKGKDDTPDAPSGSMYTFSSVESQIRVLGDYAFMLRDYELALSNYRLLSTDYKLDKAWKRYAGVQEMIGLAYFMLDQSRKEAEYCMESAFNTYLKIGLSCKRYATRCGLWWAEMLKAWGQYKEAAGVYYCISNEEPLLHAAVFLEQSSYCYLFSKPPMLRKYGFHLVLAGSRYDLSDQKQHAIRTYKSALSVYEGSAWNYIVDVVHFNIGRWHAFLGVYDVAIKHILEIVACSHQPLAMQELFLNEFVHIVQNTGKMYEVHELKLPVINTPSLQVLFEDHRTYSSPAAASIKESFWQSLEEEMVPLVAATRSNWLESLPKSSLSKKYNEFCICVAGEEIKVNVNFKNPLQTSISLSGVSLVCELLPRSMEMQSGNKSDDCFSGHGSNIHHEGAVKRFFSNCEVGASHPSFLLSERECTLRGGETIMSELTVTPKVDGTLIIHGIRWMLSGSIVGYHHFKPDPEKKKTIKGRKVKPSPSHDLKFIVIKRIPKLDGCLHNLPAKAYAGDLRLLVLELKNQSEFSVKNLKLKISNPRLLFPGRPKDMDMEFPESLQKQLSFESSGVLSNIIERPNDLLFSFPQDASIQGGTSFFWPLWMHAGLPGHSSLNLSIYYEIENSSCEMSYRTLRMHYDFEVLPSLDLAVQVIPCSSKLEFLVHMDITNRTSTESFQLRQLSSVGCQWRISSLSPDISICPSESLFAGQVLSLFFKLKYCRESLSTEGVDTDPDVHQECDMSLGSKGDQKALLDITRSPLADFHHHERAHSEKSIQGFPRSVDFVLISQPREDESSLKPGSLLSSPKLCSHHARLCSIDVTNPIWWLVDGPRVVVHDFSVSFCQTRFMMSIRNCTDAVLVIKVHTFDGVGTSQQLTDAAQPKESFGNQSGWHNISLSNDLNVVTKPQEFPSSLQPSQCVSPVVWSASSSTQVVLKPMSTTEVPLEISIFSPGTYDLSNYTLHWSLQQSDTGTFALGAAEQSSGKCPGHPFYLTVMQSP